MKKTQEVENEITNELQKCTNFNLNGDSSLVHVNDFRKIIAKLNLQTFQVTADVGDENDNIHNAKIRLNVTNKLLEAIIELKKLK